MLPAANRLIMMRFTNERFTNQTDITNVANTTNSPNYHLSGYCVIHCRFNVITTNSYEHYKNARIWTTHSLEMGRIPSQRQGPRLEWRHFCRHSTKPPLKESNFRSTRQILGIARHPASSFGRIALKAYCIITPRPAMRTE